MNRGASARFADRREAGELLARRLEADLPGEEFIVIALPRGGIVIGFAIAKRLLAPLDILIVRKLGAPGQSELAIGAIASGGYIILNQDLIERLHIGPKEIDEVKHEAEAELHRREVRYKRAGSRTQYADRNVLLVDDGIATGSTMDVAIRAIRAAQPKSLRIAVPVAALEAIERLHRSVDHIYALQVSNDLGSISEFYEAFPKVSDDEVVALLARAPNLER